MSSESTYRTIFIIVLAVQFAFALFGFSDKWLIGVDYNKGKGSDAIHLNSKPGIFIGGSTEFNTNDRNYGLSMRFESGYRKLNISQDENFLKTLTGYNASDKTYKPRNNSNPIPIGDLKFDEVYLGLVAKYLLFPKKLSVKSPVLPSLSIGILGYVHDGISSDDGDQTILVKSDPVYNERYPEGYYPAFEFTWGWWEAVFAAGVDFTYKKEKKVGKRVFQKEKVWGGIEFRYNLGLNPILNDNDIQGAKDIKNSGYSLNLFILNPFY